MFVHSPTSNNTWCLILIPGAQLTVTGGGGKTPSGSYLISLPGGITMSTPGVNVNIYSAEAATTTTYTVPGPGTHFLHLDKVVVLTIS